MGGGLLVGSQAPGCTRIAELSLDTYRVMQALEFDDGGGAGQGLDRAGWGPGDGSNPAKNILIEPEALEVVAALATLQAEGLLQQARGRAWFDPSTVCPHVMRGIFAT